MAKLVADSLVLLERELSKYRISVETDFPDVPPGVAEMEESFNAGRRRE